MEKLQEMKNIEILGYLADARARDKETLGPMTDWDRGVYILYSAYNRTRRDLLVPQQIIVFEDIWWSKYFAAGLSALDKAGINRFAYAGSSSESLDLICFFINAGFKVESTMEFRRVHDFESDPSKQAIVFSRRS